MFDQSAQTNSRWRTFWPDVSDVEGAIEAIKLGYGACFVLAGLNVVVAILAASSAVIDALIFAVLGLLVRRKSRAAAVIAAVLMSLSIALSLIRMPFVGILTIILLACLLSSVRGTFAYRRLTRGRAKVLPPESVGASD